MTNDSGRRIYDKNCYDGKRCKQVRGKIASGDCKKYNNTWLFFCQCDYVNDGKFLRLYI